MLKNRFPNFKNKNKYARATANNKIQLCFHLTLNAHLIRTKQVTRKHENQQKPSFEKIHKRLAQVPYFFRLTVLFAAHRAPHLTLHTRPRPAHGSLLLTLPFHRRRVFTWREKRRVSFDGRRRNRCRLVFCDDAVLRRFGYRRSFFNGRAALLFLFERLCFCGYRSTC